MDLLGHTGDGESYINLVFGYGYEAMTELEIANKKIELLERQVRDLAQSHHLTCQIYYPDRHKDISWTTCVEPTCKAAYMALQRILAIGS